MLALQKSKQWMTLRAKKLKEDICMLFKSSNDTVVKMSLVDKLQHLGIDHLFEDQIDTAMWQILKSEFSNYNLYEVALRFRLLREHGYCVSPDVFNRFKSEDGSFINGNGSLKTPLAQQVQRALQIPMPRTNKRVEMLHYILEYEQEEHNPILLELAKLDFNLQQNVHLKELKAIIRWWKHFLGYIELSFIRDRVVEGYTWASVLYYDTKFELTRSMITKMIVLITTLDDIYDNHATLEDSWKLHEAIQRWDKSAAFLLPEYLKKFYMEMLRTFENIEAEMLANTNYDIAHLKKAVQNNVTGYLQEAKWSHRNHKPSFVDQVKLTSLNIGVPTICVSMMAGMSDAMMKTALKWAASVPDVVISVGKISRFMNDIGAFERRKCKGDMASTVECYINEYNVTSEVAITKTVALIEHEWKTLNQARFQNHLPALQQFISLAISTTFFYGNRNDIYTG
uniref:Terpene synthase n=1 Tax=Triticum aestivum TaxID=4565 RepID=A0A3B6BWW5_WHEAT